jgi:hypothetical protein
MNHPIISRDTIRRQARRAADAGFPASACPYLDGSPFAENWLAAYIERKDELHNGAAVVSTFAGGAVEQLETVSA